MLLHPHIPVGIDLDPGDGFTDGAAFHVLSGDKSMEDVRLDLEVVAAIGGLPILSSAVEDTRTTMVFATLFCPVLQDRCPPRTKHSLCRT